jgi:hypothetical protein
MIRGKARSDRIPSAVRAGAACPRPLGLHEHAAAPAAPIDGLVEVPAGPAELFAIGLDLGRGDATTGEGVVDDDVGKVGGDVHGQVKPGGVGRRTVDIWIE